MLLLDAGRPWRGGQYQVFLLAQGLVERQHQITVLTRPDSALGGRLGQAGLTWSGIPYRGDWDLFSSLSLRRQAQPLEADIVHANDARSHAIARWAQWLGLQAPLVVTRRITRPPRSRIKYRRGVARYIAISKAVKQSLVGFGIPESRIDVVPSGIPLSRNLPEVSPTEDRSTSDRPCVMTVCSLTPEKGVDVLVRAAASSRSAGRDYRWIVLGEGPELERLQSLNHRLEGPVEFLGFAADLDHWLGQATVLACPSREEALGSVLIEGLARGLPVIASNVGGTAEIVIPEIGTLVPPEDPEALREAVEYWVTDPDRRSQVAEVGPSVASRYNSEAMIEGTIETYRTALRVPSGSK